MKRSVKYKNFLPVKFRERNFDLNRKINERAVAILVILNLILFPLNINKDEEKVKVELQDNNSEKVGIEKECIMSWLSLDNYPIKSFTIQNGFGEISVCNKDTIYLLEESGFIIDEITENSDIINLKVRGSGMSD